MIREKKSISNQPIRLEALEGRQLLSGQPWAYFGHLIGQDLVAQQYPQLTGKGESVAIIDQGVDYNHPALGGGFGAGRKVVAGWDFINNDPYPFSDTFAHGTAGAGIIAADPYVYNNTQNRGIVPDANLIALRTNSQAGIKAAMNWVLANRTKYNIVAVNFTDFGGYPLANYGNEVAALYNAGVFVGTPAGNGGPSQYVYNNSNDFTVGGIGHNDLLTSFSARGAGVDMVGPADGVTVPYYDVSRRTHVYTDAGQGTSWAAPYVVGAAAMLKQINPRFSAGQIMSILQDSGHRVYDGTSKRTYSRLDLYAAVKLAYQRSGLVAAQPATVSTQSPFSGQAIGVASSGTVIQAENFDNGGESLAYHDTTAANEGGQYRNSGVDVEATQDTGGGYDVGWVRAGEWLEYTVSVPTTGNYDFSFRLASGGAGGTFHVTQDGVNKTGAITVVNTGGWQTWQTGTVSNINLTAGTHVLRLVMDANGPTGAVANINWFKITPSAAATATPTPTTTLGALPTGWASATIGAVGPAGAAGYSNGVYTVQASGTDIWSTADGLRFTYQTLNGDGQIVARVTGVQNTNSWAKAGVMIRSSLAANAANAYMALSATQGLAFQGRLSAGANSQGIWGGAASAPFWVKLVRQGNLLTGYKSADGTTWAQVGTLNVAMGSQVLVGLAVTGHNNSTLNTSTFSNVSVSTLNAANGLRGEYYDNADFTALKFVRTDAYVNANFGYGSPDGSMGADYYSMRWTGKIVPRYNEAYTFSTTSDDGVRLWINGQLIIDNWSGHSATENTGTITLQAGVKYDIKLEYCDLVGPAQISLSWASASQAKQAVPTSQLFVA